MRLARIVEDEAVDRFVGCRPDDEQRPRKVARAVSALMPADAPVRSPALHLVGGIGGHDGDGRAPFEERCDLAFGNGARADDDDRLAVKV